jgi:hypothetical protein
MLRERVTPAMLHPLVCSVTATTDMQWVLLCVGIAVAALLFTLRYGYLATKETTMAP